MTRALRGLIVVAFVLGYLVGGAPAHAAGAGLKLNVRTSAAVAQVNDTIRYTLTIENTGSRAIRTVTVKDFVDDDLDVVSVPILDRVAAAGLSSMLEAEEIFWTITKLRPGEKVTVSYKATVVKFGDGLLENVARAVGSDGSDTETITSTYLFRRACFGRFAPRLT
jgi:uncharacterized repeat protein (TIGR01451 family)